MHENREISETPAAKPGSRSAGEGDSRTARTYVSEESHSGIVLTNHSNNDKTSSAESGEGRPLIKENAGQPSTYSTQSGERVSQGLAGVRKAARENKDLSMDPVWANVDHAWVWRDGGAYYGVPVSNFLGWFLTVYVFYQLFALYLRNRVIIPAETAPWRLAIFFYALSAVGNLLGKTPLAARGASPDS